MDTKAIGSIIIFTGAYILIAAGKINKTIVAILGAVLMLLFHLMSFEEAMASVDFNVIFLLVGMMSAMYILSKTGFFQYIAVSIAKRAHGSPLRIMFLLLIITAVTSAFLDNVTTIVLLVPVTILISQILEISPVPFVITEALEDEEMSKHGVEEYIADGVIVLKTNEALDTRTIKIRKMRLTKHTLKPATFDITNQGITVRPPKGI